MPGGIQRRSPAPSGADGWRRRPGSRNRLAGSLRHFRPTALTSVVATGHLPGVSNGWTDGSPVGHIMARDLDEPVTDFRKRPLDTDPSTFGATHASRLARFGSVAMRTEEGQA